jgi:MFS family permease
LRGREAVVFYSLAVVAGPTLGPIIGGAVSQSHLGWRWTEYLAVILTGVVVAADAVFLPETFAPVLLTRKARRLRLKTRKWALHSRQEEQDFTLRMFLEKNLLRPVRMLFTEPMCLLITLYNSFACELSFPSIWGRLYANKTLQMECESNPVHISLSPRLTCSTVSTSSSPPSQSYTRRIGDGTHWWAHCPSSACSSVRW